MLQKQTFTGVLRKSISEKCHGKFHEKTSTPDFLLNKVAVCKLANLLKESPAYVISFECCDVFQKFFLQNTSRRVSAGLKTM